MRPPSCAVLILSLSACGGRAVAPRARQAGGGNDGGQSTRTASCTFKGFADPVAYTTSGNPRALVTTDLTGDGQLDVLVAGSRDNVASLELLTNTGSGAFSLSALPVSINPSSSALVAADFNGDGIIDLASQSNSASGIDLATNDGVLAFDFGTGYGALASQSVTLATPQTSGRVAAGDFDGDGRPDLAFAGYDYVMAGGGVTPDGRVSLPGPEPTNFALNVFRLRR